MPLCAPERDAHAVHTPSRTDGKTTRSDTLSPSTPALPAPGLAFRANRSLYTRVWRRRRCRYLPLYRAPVALFRAPRALQRHTMLVLLPMTVGMVLWFIGSISLFLQPVSARFLYSSLFLRPTCPSLCLDLEFGFLRGHACTCPPTLPTATHLPHYLYRRRHDALPLTPTHLFHEPLVPVLCPLLYPATPRCHNLHSGCLVVFWIYLAFMLRFPTLPTHRHATLFYPRHLPLPPPTHSAYLVSCLDSRLHADRG